MAKWHRCIDKDPPKDTELLVYRKGHGYLGMFEAEYHDLSKWDDVEWHNSVIINGHRPTKEEYLDMLRKEKGRFKDFGLSYYFNDPKLYWAYPPPFPEAP